MPETENTYWPDDALLEIPIIQKLLLQPQNLIGIWYCTKHDVLLIQRQGSNRPPTLSLQEFRSPKSSSTDPCYINDTGHRLSITNYETFWNHFRVLYLSSPYLPQMLPRPIPDQDLVRRLVSILPEFVPGVLSLD